MGIIDKIRELFRRKPITDEDLRARQEAKIAGDNYRGLKASQLSNVGEYDASARGGRGKY